nr:hypothetical protein Itr_chr04CG23390 [Ipomoea trifida]
MAKDNQRGLRLRNPPENRSPEVPPPSGNSEQEHTKPKLNPSSNRLKLTTLTSQLNETTSFGFSYSTIHQSIIHFSSSAHDKELL